MDQVTEPKRRGRRSTADRVAEGLSKAVDALTAVVPEKAPEVAVSAPAPLFSIAVPAWIEEVPLNEQCPADVLLSLRSQIGVVCHFKDGRLICADGRVFRVVVKGRTAEVFNG